MAPEDDGGPAPGTAIFSAFPADDEVGRDLAAVDWAATPLGPPEDWPQSLRTAVSILLSSRFSMWMAWGPELTFFCNAAYRRDTLGHKYPWALGRPAAEVWAEIWGDIGPRIDAVLRTGQATWDEALLLFLERAGYPEETYHTFSYSPLRDDAGAVVGMLCVVSEETERVTGERRMATLRDLGSDPSVVRTEQEMLAFAGRQFGHNPRDLPFTLTYLFDDDGRARLAASTGIAEGHPAAPADAAGVWPAEALAAGKATLVELDGDPFRDLPCGAWAESPTRALAVPLLQQGSAPYGFLVAGLNRYRPLNERYRGFLELAAGHVAAGIASARSYEAQQRRAEELAELDRAKTVFFSNISHEFRTPLTLIMGPVSELRAALADAEPQVLRDLEVIHRNGLRLGKLVNTLLDFSRIEAGRMQARYEPVDLAAVTAELASVFRSAVDKAGLVFRVDCPPLPEPVCVDREMWEKVVFNLLSNALKFTFDGSITVAVGARDGQAEVTISDTGIGIAADELPRLFERFHRIESARSRSNEGSGIGLALVQELVGLHGGTITAASAEGEGTTFTIRLPFGSAHLPAGSVVPARSAEPVPALGNAYVQEVMRWLPEDDPGGELPAGARSAVPGDGAPPRVLVADDNGDMREYLVRLLRGAGYQVSAVGDGLRALDAVRAEAPDLVVSDVMMPHLDGLALVAALRSDPRTAGVPVLLLSARAGQEAAIEGLSAGADDYLVKPFSAAELLARARANVELARMRNHHIRWRNAMIDSLQEAFFVTDEDGAVIEINAAFTDILGYGTDGLPYTPMHPWWPDQDADPQGHALAAELFGRLVGEGRGSGVIPAVHRDGHQVWIAVTFNEVTDPDTRRRRVVGTLRDVTAEHHLVQRESALAALSMRASQADNLAGALSGGLAALQEVWRARQVLAALWTDAEAPLAPAEGPPVLVGVPDGGGWDELPEQVQGALSGLREQPPLRPVASETDGAGITLEHPEGLLAVWVDLGQNRPFSTEDRTLLALLAGHLGQLLHRVHQLDQQREAAVALQRAILGPSTLPDGFAVRYEPAGRPLEVGGDWYDIVPLAGARIGIVVGDCVGRGLGAATVMGQLRSACRALLLQNSSPAQVFTTLDRFAALIPGAKCTTVFCGVLDTATGDLVYASAGHPPGILARADGGTTLLEGGRSTPLAVRPARPRSEATCTMPPRSTLLLYTDGLVERRRRPLTAGIDQASAAVQDGRSTPIEDLATEVMARLAPDGGYSDDVALLLYRQPAPLEVAFPAESSQLAPVRSALRTWLSRCQVTSAQAQSILVAAGEACANAIEHGHRDSPGETIRLRAVATGDDVRLTVADTGRWKAPQPEANPHRGRGVALMRALMQEVTIQPGAAGTIVDMHARIAR
ncbi:SpoIIE family protein phosphatase [Nonomuraea sp. NPDC049419]|uniref:SpoIIE family protein phosphatase n=1 Tax=Nonomuraea sp. NPDC049419 TaxID=3155772 RepID=UPI00342A8057